MSSYTSLIPYQVGLMNFSGISASELPIYIKEQETRELSCEGCLNGEALDFDFTMAFQPLIDLSQKRTFGFEGLVRGLNNEPAYTVISQITAKNIYKFDQSCRVKAIALAAEAKIKERLSINFMPGAVYKPNICIRTTLAAADKYGFPREQITFEVVEGEKIADTAHLQNIIDYYKEIGFKVAIDDFGSGFANLDWLAKLAPDSIKIDMSLIRGIDTSNRKTLIVKALAELCSALNIDVLAEGVETKAERDTLAELNIVKQQGYFFSPPLFETFPSVPEKKFN